MMSQLTHKTPSLIGGILLVIGNVIGAGILALPVAIAELGLPLAILTIFIFWLVMMLGAYYFLEANVSLKSGSNLISMSRAALGSPGVLIAWISNLVVMYSLIAAYLSGGGDLIKVNFHYLAINLSSPLSAILFLMIFGWIVSRGIHMTDHANRLLMLIKAVIFFAVLIGLATHFNFATISIKPPSQRWSFSLIIIVLTSFGFATLIPSLRHYYASDIKKIKKIIFWGSFIPLICYILWITSVFSILPYHGNHGLEQMMTSSHPVSDLQMSITVFLHKQWITQATNLFSAICIVTSFLANSISLTDFLADGLNLNKHHRKPFIVYFVAYFPALMAVLFYQKAFLIGLSIAGTMAIIQLLLLPGLIVWKLRYSDKKIPLNYSVMGGKPLLLAFIILGFTLLILSKSTL